MRNFVTLSAALTFAIVLSVPALAGHGEKCTYETQECLNYMAQHYQAKGWCGIELDAAGEGEVMKVTRVVPESPAEAGGFMVGDVLLGFNGQEFATADEASMKAAKKGMTVGADVIYIIERDGEKKELQVHLDKVPEDVLAAWVGQHMLEHAELASASTE